MPERGMEPAAEAADPGSTTQDPATQGGAPQKPTASGVAPSRPRRRLPPRCPECDKAFSYPSKLATHRLAHGGARPHPCPDCPEAFSYPSKLAAHRLTHSGAHPHPCPDCPKAFSFPSKLAAHRLCHDPPAAPGGQASGCHRCSNCDQAFGQRCLLLLPQCGHHQAQGQGERQ